MDIPSRTHMALPSMLELKEPIQACKDESWNKAMREKLNQIEKTGTSKLVPIPENKNVIGTKWIFKNKLNEEGKTLISKAKLVYKGYA